MAKGSFAAKIDQSEQSTAHDLTNKNRTCKYLADVRGRGLLRQLTNQICPHTREKGNRQCSRILNKAAGEASIRSKERKRRLKISELLRDSTSLLHEFNTSPTNLYPLRRTKVVRTQR